MLGASRREQFCTFFYDNGNPVYRRRGGKVTDILRFKTIIDSLHIQMAFLNAQTALKFVVVLMVTNC